MTKLFKLIKNKLIGLYRVITNKQTRTQYIRLKAHLDTGCIELAEQIREALKTCHDDIPVFVISYNNGVYVKNMVDQLRRFKIAPIVIDNNSKDVNTKVILNKLQNEGNVHIVFSNKNFGHVVGFLDPIYSVFPEIFAYTDPDLQLNQNLPLNFLRALADLTDTFRSYKAGFALSLLKDEEIIDHRITRQKVIPALQKEFSIREWQSHHWDKRLNYKKLEVYAADIDTTFAVYRKSNYRGNIYDAVRVAGDYEAIHLPWFPNLDLFSDQDIHAYIKGNISSSLFVDLD